MKKRKLSLDKLPIVKLTNTEHIFGGREGGLSEKEPTGIGVASVPAPYRPKRNHHLLISDNCQSGVNPRHAPRSSKQCLG